jgi:hypothetical protein
MGELQAIGRVRPGEVLRYETTPCRSELLEQLRRHLQIRGRKSFGKLLGFDELLSGRVGTFLSARRRASATPFRTQTRSHTRSSQPSGGV